MFINRTIATLFFLLTSFAFAQKPAQPKPGWNFFSKQQDLQLGKEAAEQVRQQYAIVPNKNLEDYCNRIIARLASSPVADGASYPYKMQVVYDKSINAFALPGGPMFVHTGLISAAENEAQMAAVLAHEMSHVALRHGTSQMSKANLLQIPAAIASGVLGSSGSMLGQLGSLGINAAASGFLLKFSRGAERDADLLGSRIMYDAGYDPSQMARFFEKLEEKTGKSNNFAEFLSDHPNPENRVKSVETQIKFYSPRKYDNGTPADLDRAKGIISGLPNMEKPKRVTGAQGQGGTPVPVNAGPVPQQLRISRNFQTYEAKGFRIGYPQEWTPSDNARQNTITLAPKESTFQTQNGSAYGYGAQASLFQTSGQADLRNDTTRLLNQLQAAGITTAGEPRTLKVDGQDGLLTLMTSPSPYQNEQETDVLLTVARPEGLFYVIFFAPKSAYQKIESVFEQMTTSIKFR